MLALPLPEPVNGSYGARRPDQGSLRARGRSYNLCKLSAHGRALNICLWRKAVANFGSGALAAGGAGVGRHGRGGGDKAPAWLRAVIFSELNSLARLCDNRQDAIPQRLGRDR